jgi:hypothetical protein
MIDGFSNTNWLNPDPVSDCPSTEGGVFGTRSADFVSDKGLLGDLDSGKGLLGDLDSVKGVSVMLFVSVEGNSFMDIATADGGGEGEGDVGTSPASDFVVLIVVLRASSIERRLVGWRVRFGGICMPQAIDRSMNRAT